MSKLEFTTLYDSLEKATLCVDVREGFNFLKITVEYGLCQCNVHKGVFLEPDCNVADI